MHPKSFVQILNHIPTSTTLNNWINIFHDPKSSQSIQFDAAFEQFALTGRRAGPWGRCAERAEPLLDLDVFAVLVAVTAYPYDEDRLRERAPARLALDQVSGTPQAHSSTRVSTCSTPARIRSSSASPISDAISPGVPPSAVI